MKVVWVSASSLVVGLYTGFVLQSLWNWFLVSALHGSEVSYWQTYGIVLLVRVFSRSDTVKGENRWDMTVAMLRMVVPPEKQQEVDALVKKEEDNVWVNAGAVILAEMIGNTVVLAIGWVVHTFLV